MNFYLIFISLHVKRVPCVKRRSKVQLRFSKDFSKVLVRSCMPNFCVLHFDFMLSFNGQSRKIYILTMSPVCSIRFYLVKGTTPAQNHFYSDFLAVSKCPFKVHSESCCLCLIASCYSQCINWVVCLLSTIKASFIMTPDLGCLFQFPIIKVRKSFLLVLSQLFFAWFTNLLIGLVAVGSNWMCFIMAP